MLRNLLIFFVLVQPLLCKSEIVDFDESMGIQNKMQYELMFKEKSSESIYNFYKKLYESNITKKAQLRYVDRIPKIIHHIWVGPKPVPELYKKYANQCRKVNPGWKYKLWTEKEVSRLIKDPNHRLLFDYMGNRYGGKKDIMEYSILYQYGGVVMDMDMECVKPMGPLVEKYDFFAAMEPGVCWSKIPVMTNAMIGSVAGNPVFLDALNSAVIKAREYDLVHNKGIKLWFRYLKSFLKKIEVMKVADPRRILMLNFAENFRNNYTSFKRPIVFPATYFNPIFPKQYKCYSLWNKAKLFFKPEYNKNYFQKVRPETIAVQDFYD